jgi:hypothetical protein
MGPESKEQVCNAIGYLIEEQERTRVLLERIERMLTRRSEVENADLVQVNRRVTELERRLRASPA